MDHINTCKDTLKIIGKYEVDMKKLETLALGLSGLEVTLSTKIDPYGEYMSIPFVDILKDVTSQIITEIRNEDHMPLKPELYWLT